jgi:hypothetical protein
MPSRCLEPMIRWYTQDMLKIWYRYPWDRLWHMMTCDDLNEFARSIQATGGKVKMYGINGRI